MIRDSLVRLSYWEVLNLARIYLHKDVQQGGAWCRPGIVPGFTDRDGVWHSSLASTVIARAIGCISVDYLLCYPPCFLEQPYAIVDLISYCDTRQLRHRGTVYEMAGFRQERQNSRGLRTYAKEMRALSYGEDSYIRQAALESRRSQTYRARRQAVDEWRQLAL